MRFSTSVNYDDFEMLTEVVVESQQSLLFIFRNREDECIN